MLMPSGRILIMTTNAPDALDEALIRPGRIDSRIAFKNATSSMAYELFKKLYATDTLPVIELEDLAQVFASQIPPLQLSPAELQEYILRNKCDPNAAVEGVAAWSRATVEAKARRAERHQKRIAEQRATEETYRRQATVRFSGRQAIDQFEFAGRTTSEQPVVQPTQKRPTPQPQDTMPQQPRNMEPQSAMEKQLPMQQKDFIIQHPANGDGGK
jgi:SpoVK/Ycf46/Vps4 family AAA+-type ATPase